MNTTRNEGEGVFARHNCNHKCIGLVTKSSHAEVHEWTQVKGGV